MRTMIYTEDLKLMWKNYKKPTIGFQVLLFIQNMCLGSKDDINLRAYMISQF